MYFTGTNSTGYLLLVVAAKWIAVRLTEEQILGSNSLVLPEFPDGADGEEAGTGGARFPLPSTQLEAWPGGGSHPTEEQVSADSLAPPEAPTAPLQGQYQPSAISSQPWSP